ncbi:MAG TPA: SDR family NAD(P)-dependent oxidoreductase, partial [Acidimicrobiales bacterium]|nr:SDR family NAD(P)-dependent oxidoreductase [Acidimicrobiales bacterium]
KSPHYAGATAVVTGAGSGIGRALALELAGKEVNLALSDVDTVGLSETVSRCAHAAKGSAKARGFRVDVADRQAVLSHAEEVVSEFGRVDLVFNNAGVALTATVEDMKWEDFDWLMGINFGGVVHGTKAFLPHLISSGDGYLVNISSVFGFIGVPSQSAYNAAKFGVRGFTEALRQEMIMERRPVTVCCVHPGGIRTNIARNSRTSTLDEAEKQTMANDFDRVARTSPERAARTILRGMERRRPRILVGPDAYAIDAMEHLLGARYQALVARAARRSPLGSA